MASTQQPSQVELRAQLARTRDTISSSLEQFKRGIDVPSRLRSDLQAHPVKWMAVSAGLGYAAIKLVPLVLRMTTKSWPQTLISPLMRTAAASMLPIVAERLSNKFLNTATPPPVPELRAPMAR